MKTIAINGFGRIGRVAARVLIEKNRLDRLVAVNDLTDAKTLAHLLKYDTAYGPLELAVSATDPPGPVYQGGIRVGHHLIGVLSQTDPAKLPWKDLQVDLVIESTGQFTERAEAEKHLAAGAKRVIISAPSKGDQPAPTSILGVNAGHNDEPVINNASCTTNSIAPMIAVLQAAFGIEKALMTTVHGYTADQNLQDGPHKDLRRARAAAENIVPTTTGAALATTEAIPELKGKFDGTAIRVPVSVGSLSDITALLKQSVTVEAINAAFRQAAEDQRYQGTLEVTDEPLVSSDIIGRSASVIVDLSLTKVIGGNLVKVFGWYDNEWGYASRLVEQALRLAGEG